MSDYLIGRKEIANYARVSVWTVTAMVKCGLECSGGRKKGSPPITTKNKVDNFFKENLDFTANKYHNR